MEKIWNLTKALSAHLARALGYPQLDTVTVVSD